MSQVVIAEEWEDYRVETTFTASEDALGKLRIGSPASVGELDQLLVTEVRNLQVSVTMSDSDEMGEAFQAILRSRKAEVEEQLDGLGAATRQLLVVDQDRHDSIFESTWESHEKLVDEIVTATFLPVAQRVPVARGADGRPDRVVEVLVDVALGFKRFVYRISQNDEVVRVVSELPTATLDTNIPFELWMKGDRKGVVDRLIEIAASMPMSLRVTGRIREDVSLPPLADRIYELPELGIDLMGSVIRYGHWEAGTDTFGSAKFEQVRESIVDRAGRMSGHPGSGPDWRDWDHVHAHYLSKRDAFLTWDGPLLACAKELKEGLDIVVMPPEQYLEELDSDWRGMAARGSVI